MYNSNTNPKQRSSSENGSFNMINKIPFLLWNLKVYQYEQNSPPMDLIQPTFTHHFFQIHFNIILMSIPTCLKWYLPLLVFPLKCVSHFLSFPCMPHVPPPFHPRFDHPNNISEEYEHEVPHLQFAIACCFPLSISFNSLFILKYPPSGMLFSLGKRSTACPYTASYLIYGSSDR